METKDIKKLVELFRSCNFTHSADALEELLKSAVWCYARI